MIDLAPLGDRRLTKREQEVLHYLVRGNRNLKWKKVEFSLVVFIRGGQAELVSGTARGLRKDNQEFFAQVSLPWQWKQPFNWMRTARKRLDTFLHPKCVCAAKAGDVIICLLHSKLNDRWKKEDNRLLAKAGQRGWWSSPHLGKEPGAALDPLRILHRDYPWARYDEKNNQFVCLLCKARRDAAENPSYRNQFIWEHSFCGEKQHTPLPQSIEDQNPRAGRGNAAR